MRNMSLNRPVAKHYVVPYSSPANLNLVRRSHGDVRVRVPRRKASGRSARNKFATPAPNKYKSRNARRRPKVLSFRTPELEGCGDTGK